MTTFDFAQAPGCRAWLPSKVEAWSRQSKGEPADRLGINNYPFADVCDNPFDFF
jgi:hypothetical protein